MVDDILLNALAKDARVQRETAAAKHVVQERLLEITRSVRVARDGERARERVNGDGEVLRGLYMSVGAAMACVQLTDAPPPQKLVPGRHVQLRVGQFQSDEFVVPDPVEETVWTHDDAVQ